MQQLTLADLELPPGTFDGFSPEQIADVVQAATDGAHAKISAILGGELDDARIQLAVSR